MSTEAWNSLILESSKGATLPALLMALLDLQTMRQIATEKGIGAKGFRVEKASVQRLGPLLAKEAAKNEGLREELAKALHAIREKARSKPSKSTSTPEAVDSPEMKALELQLRKAEKKCLREADSAKKARDSRQKSLKELSALAKTEADLRREFTRLTNEYEAWKQSAIQNQIPESGSEEKLLETAERAQSRLEERIADLEELDRVHRISEAGHLSRIRELDALSQELEALLPRGKKERLKKFQKSLVEKSAAPGLTPIYSREFLDALERVSEADQHRIHATLAQVVLGGLEQPGLRVKSLKGRGELLSLRAGLHYRVYFTRIGDKIHLHHVGTREEQETFLKKWRT